MKKDFAVLGRMIFYHIQFHMIPAKSKPVERQRRKATGLKEVSMVAGLPGVRR